MLRNFSCPQESFYPVMKWERGGHALNKSWHPKNWIQVLKLSSKLFIMKGQTWSHWALPCFLLPRDPHSCVACFLDCMMCKRKQASFLLIAITSQTLINVKNFSAKNYNGKEFCSCHNHKVLSVCLLFIYFFVAFFSFWKVLNMPGSTVPGCLWYGPFIFKMGIFACTEHIPSPGVNVAWMFTVGAEECVSQFSQCVLLLGPFGCPFFRTSLYSLRTHSPGVPKTHDFECTTGQAEQRKILTPWPCGQYLPSV